MEAAEAAQTAQVAEAPRLVTKKRGKALPKMSHRSQPSLSTSVDVCDLVDMFVGSDSPSVAKIKTFRSKSLLEGVATRQALT